MEVVYSSTSLVLRIMVCVPLCCYQECTSCFVWVQYEAVRLDPSVVYVWLYVSFFYCLYVFYWLAHVWCFLVCVCVFPSMCVCFLVCVCVCFVESHSSFTCSVCFVCIKLFANLFMTIFFVGLRMVFVICMFYSHHHH